MDDPSACPYTDGLSDKLPFNAQARPRRMISLQYKWGHCIDWAVFLLFPTVLLTLTSISQQSTNCNRLIIIYSKMPAWMSMSSQHDERSVLFRRLFRQFLSIFEQSAGPLKCTPCIPLKFCDKNVAFICGIVCFVACVGDIWRRGHYFFLAARETPRVFQTDNRNQPFLRSEKHLSRNMM